MLLPDEILTEDAERLFAEFKHWADEKIREHSGLATVADFWARLGMPVPDKINKKEAELMQNFARRAGYALRRICAITLSDRIQKVILFYFLKGMRNSTYRRRNLRQSLWRFGWVP